MGSAHWTIVFCIVVLFGCATQTYDTPPAASGMHAGMSMDNSRTALSKAMRDLWADHVVWTHNYIVAATSDQPDADAASKRLLANQDQIGQAIVPYYGQAAGNQLSALLRDHILIAVDVVKAAKANDQAKLRDADQRWHSNAGDIARFLSGANPNWSHQDVLTMMNEHLALTTQATVARLKKNWTEEISTFDKIYDQAMMMADALTNGIVKQFPDRFRS
jgi:hypothetical protein